MFCPPVALAAVFSLGFNSLDKNELKISRPAENGGDIVFQSRAEIESAFAEGEHVLHPGDLKGAVIPIMVSTLEKLNAAIKADGEALKASKTLKATAKKMAKNKGKK